MSSAPPGSNRPGYPPKPTPLDPGRARPLPPPGRRRHAVLAPERAAEGGVGLVAHGRGLGEESLSVLPRQPVQRRLLGPVALTVDRRAIRGPWAAL